MAYNELKARALAIFERSGGLNPSEWAVRAQFYPIRASYSYLMRLHRFGLLCRSRDRRGRILYSLSTRGRLRLEWLRLRAPVRG